MRTWLHALPPEHHALAASSDLTQKLRALQQSNGKPIQQPSGKLIQRAIPSSGEMLPAISFDPAQESVSRQPGGGGSGTGAANLPEFRVVSVRTVDGSCTR